MCAIAARRPAVSRNTVIAAITNDSESRPNEAPMPTVATNRPASGGPNRFASCIVDSTSAFAGAIASSSTVRGTSDRNAGMWIASTMPNAMPMSASCHSWTAAPKMSSAIAALRPARIRFEARSSERAGSRSESAPPTSSVTARGIWAASSTVPSASPEPVTWSTSQASATKWNWSPSSETVSPDQSSRKSRTASGCHSGSERTRPSAVAGAAVEAVTRGRSSRCRRRGRRSPR